ncbi:MAG: chitinase, partial [Pseudomonas sp.]|nr:chitinase [Pseudomonas sp.]
LPATFGRLHGLPAVLDFAALKLVKDHYAAEGKHFIISMAPEFPYLTSAGRYVDYLKALEGYYDFIAPQFYNQGGDGLWVQEANNGKGAWIAQNNDALKEDFLFYLTESLVSGTRGFTRIPADKFVIGLPANVDAAATGYVVNPTALTNAFKRLYAKGVSIKGLMTWSVNWDNGVNKDHVPYNQEFSRRYGPLINGTKAPARTRKAPTGA